MTAPTAPSVRAGDREREKTANQLGQALAQGYLAMDEYETRLQAAFAAHTTAELRQLVADLPLAQLRRNDPRRRAGTPEGGTPRRPDPPRRLPGDGRHRAHGVARRRPDRGRLVLLADLADPRRGHRRHRPRTADPRHVVESVPHDTSDRSRPRRATRSAAGRRPTRHSRPGAPAPRREVRHRGARRDTTSGARPRRPSVVAITNRPSRSSSYSRVPPQSTSGMRLPTMR